MCLLGLWGSVRCSQAINYHNQFFLQSCTFNAQLDLRFHLSLCYFFFHNYLLLWYTCYAMHVLLLCTTKHQYPIESNLQQCYPEIEVNTHHFVLFQSPSINIDFPCTYQDSLVSMVHFRDLQSFFQLLCTSDFKVPRGIFIWIYVLVYFCLFILLS